MNPLLILLVLALPLVSRLAQAQIPDLNPKPDLSPEQVVQYQISALQHNDDPAPDAGIERAFRFASPQNKEVTGPLARFAQIVKGPAYSSMLHSLSCSVVGSNSTAEKAAVYVRILTPSGRKAAFLFILSKQIDGAYTNCWMTDSASPVDLEEDSQEEGVTI